MNSIPTETELKSDAIMHRGETLAEELVKPAPGLRAPPVTGVWRIVYCLLAVVFLILGIVGAVLPGLPTTPFLLLMSYFLVRVSPALHARVLGWPIVGKPLRDWDEKRGVRPGTKWFAVSMVLVLVSISLLLGNLHWGIKSGIVVLAMIGLYVVYRLPTIRD